MKGLGFAASGLAALAVAYAALTTPAFGPVRTAYGSSEGRLLDRHGELLQTLRLDARSRQLDWVSLAQVSPLLPRTLIAIEDRRFAAHPGVDPLAVGAALIDGLRGRGWRGASTLTMQLAADLHGRGSRHTLGSKLRQAVDALALELRWSKAEILEAYLNRVSFRGETRGIGAAARLLFGKEPAALDADDSLLLVAGLAAPGAAPQAWGERACRLAAATPGRCAALRTLALDAARPDRPDALPQLAPHLARALLRRPGTTVTSTLDAALQRAVADILRTQLLALGPQQVRDGAAVVLDNASGELLAYIGSAGPASSASQVDGARAPRQAGSTLKPFLYALALERGLLTPASLLDDSPLAIGAVGGLYAPQNYDHAFRGLVSLRTALASSLNVPAVRTLMLIGPDRLHATLQRAGYAHLLPDPDAHGYALALGAADVTLLEQANAYRTLANGGLHTPLRLTSAAAAPQAAVTPLRVFDERAAWLVGDILADRGARAATFGLENALATRHWSAVKTGTSKNMRDNWCIGWSRHYTVAVWVGNFEGDPMRAVSGVTGAAPAWTAIMDRLERDTATAAPAPPPGLLARRVEFGDGVEPPRREWFLAGTGQARISAVPPTLRRSRIVRPVDGEVLALDPDIPVSAQQLLLGAEPALPDQRWSVDGRPLPARAPARWPLAPGRHTIELTAADSGEALDRVEILVRGGR
ncbi:MAG: penicillin-binding protein 1C [Gammaproteobacteria bacterium]|nr:penicillin-binding protein 1C [Gammaproteobacteria bacterium]